MIKIRHVLISCLLAYSQLSISHEVEDDRIAIGLELGEITRANLLDILVLHNFTATEKGVVVYVLPRVAADIFNSELGEIWRSK